jgi:hypothetical protein
VPVDAYSRGQNNGTIPGEDRSGSENALGTRRRAVRFWRWVIRLGCVDHVRLLLLRGARPRTMYHLQNITEGSDPQETVVTDVHYHLGVGLEHSVELGTTWFDILRDMYQPVMGTKWEHQLEFAIMTTCEHKDQDADQGRLHS